MKGALQFVTQRTMIGLASYLGSTARTLLVRCPCGRRNYFDRKGWAWLEVAFCVRCWQAIRYHDLRVISRWEGERMLREQDMYEGELKALRTIEAEMRRFLMLFRQQPVWMWPPQVVSMVQAVATSLQLAEQARRHQGTEPTVPLDQPVTAAPEQSATQEEEEETGGEMWRGRPPLDSEEARLLDSYGLLPRSARMEVLAHIEEVRRAYGAGAQG